MAKYKDVVHDRLQYILVIVYCVSNFVTSQEEADFPVVISRRSSGDIVYFNSNKSYIMFVLVIILLTWSTRGDVLIMKTCLMVSLIVVVSYMSL